MPKRKTDPLLAALIAKLPATGTEWSIEQQQAWLRNMAMAFGLVYGGEVKLEQPATVAPNNAPKIALPPKPQKLMHPFIIDKDGYVRRGTGQRVLPGEVDDEIVDERRSEDVKGPDLRTIIWADDSTGLNGADLTIHA